MNIQANDLRIGNLVYDAQNIIREIEAIHPDIIHFKNSGSNRVEVIKPIPLSDDILLKLGFEYFKEVGYCDKDHIIYETKDGWLIDVNSDNKNEIEFKYLHTLQNLIKLLTGNDLNVSGVINK